MKIHAELGLSDTDDNTGVKRLIHQNSVRLSLHYARIPEESPWLIK